MSFLDPVKNFAKVIVSTLYDASATTIVLSSGEGVKLPDPATDGAFNLVWWNSEDYPDPTDDPNVEIVRCTARATNTLTIVRAQEGTSASTKNSSGKIYKMILTLTEKTITDIDAHNHSGIYEPANANIQSHISSTLNPHSVTKTQLTLGNVENTALSTWAGTANIVTVGDIIAGRTALTSGLVSTDELLVSDAGVIKKMDVSVLTDYTSSLYYTKTNMQTSGQSSVHWGNITNEPTTLSGYGITDAVPVSGGTFTGDIIANKLSIQLAGADRAVLSNDGVLRLTYFSTVQANSYQNVTMAINSMLQLNTTGAVISRNIADANSALTVNLINASATGNILNLQKEGTSLGVFTYDGKLGIGTEIPDDKLSVVGNIAVTGTVDGVDVSAIPSTYSVTSHNHTLDSLSNTTISANTSGEILKWNGTAWINNTLSEAGISAVGHNHSGTYIEGISAGTLIDVSGTSTITVNVDLSELTTSVADADGDYFVVVDSLNAQKKLTKANINISGFNNDAGYITAQTDSQTLTWTGSTGVLAISGGNSVDLDGRYLQSETSHADVLVDSDIGVNVQAYSLVLANTTASFTTVDETKLDYISVTQAVNLDTMESNIATNNAKVTMTYPGSGIALSTGSAWGTSITNNSSNWNTAYGWGNHAGLYSVTSHNHTLDGLSNVTVTTNSIGEILKWNGSAWINNTLAEAGIQPSGSYLTGNQTITLSGDVSGSGTTSIVCTVANNSHTHTMANISDSTWTSYAEPGIFSGGGTPTLATGVTGAEIRSLIGAGTSSTTGTVTSVSGTGSVSGLTLTGTITTSGSLTLGGSITGFSTTSHNHTLDSLSNVTITTNTSGEVLKWNGTAWINNTLAEAGIQPAGSYLTGNQTITLSGDVSGSGTTSITCTVADNSHNHTVSNISDSTTVGQNLVKLTNPSAITFLRVNADNTVTALSDSAFRTAIGAGTSSTVGTVTSVSGTGSVSGLTLTGTVTSSGSLTLGGSITGFSTTSHNHTLDGLSNVTITTNTSGEILKWTGTAWINNTLSEAGIQAYSAVLANTTASFLTAQETKLSYISVTQAVNLDTMESNIATNNAKVTMTYPGAGIPLSTGSAWGTSITNNSANWNTAYGWGNHAGLYSTTSHNHTLDALSNVTITTNTSGEILKWSGTAWINNTLAEAGISAVGHTHSYDNYSSWTIQDGDTTTYTVTSGDTLQIVGGTGITSNFTADDVLTITNSAPHVGTNISWTAGTTAGPICNSSTGTDSAIPVASGTASGVVTTGAQTFAGTKTFSSAIAGSITGSSASCTGNASTADQALVTTSDTAGTFSLVYSAIPIGSSYNSLYTDSGITYAPNTNTLTIANFVGNLTGNASGSSGSCTGNSASATYASNLTLADRQTAASHYITFSATATGNVAQYTDAGLTYNPSTNALSTTTFIGALTGTASGNLVSGGALGTPSSGNLANCTFPTLNQNTTGSSGSCTGNAATASQVYVADEVSNSSFKLLFAQGTDSNLAVKNDANLYYNPSTNVLTTATVSATLSGNITVSTVTTDNVCYPLFSTVSSGNTAPSINTGFIYDSIANSLTATSFIGALSGNASTATTLATARTIAGVSFNGSANIDIPFANLTSKPTTLSGYGITDGLTHQHKFMYSHNYTIPEVEDGDLVEFFVPVMTGTTVKITEVRYQTDSGTCTIAINKNGTGLTGFTAISVTSTAASTDASDQTLADNDLIGCTISSNSTALKLTVSIYFEVTVATGV